MGDERLFLGARLAAGHADPVRGSGEGRTDAIGVSASVGRDSGISGDARGRVSAGVPGQDSELLQLALLGDHGRAVDIGGPGAHVYLGRVQVESQQPQASPRGPPTLTLGLPAFITVFAKSGT